MKQRARGRAILRKSAWLLGAAGLSIRAAGAGNVEKEPGAHRQPVEAPAVVAYDVFLVGGQSNAEGRISIRAPETPAYIASGRLEGVKSWNGSAIVDYDVSQVGPQGTGASWISALGKNRWGPMQVALHLLSRVSPHPILVCQVTEGGTMLSPLPRRAQNKGSWSADFHAIFPGGEALLDALGQRWEALDAYARENEITLYVRGLLWHQGEADYDVSNNPDLLPEARATAVTDYGDHWASLVAYVRSALVKNPCFPVFYGTVPAASRKFSAEIRSAQRAFADADARAWCRDNDDLSFFDGLHVDAASCRVFGQWMADRVNEAVYDHRPPRGKTSCAGNPAGR